LDKKNAPPCDHGQKTYEKPHLRHLNYDELLQLLEKRASENNEAKTILEYLNEPREKIFIN